MSLDAVHAAVRDGKLSPDAATNLIQWLEGPEYKAFHDDLAALIAAGEWKTLEDGFYTHIQFGTGGMRGHTGIGPALVNSRTISAAAQGLASHLKDSVEHALTRGVVIAHDTRITSEDLAQTVASVFVANGFKVYFFDGYRATPELSFAVRQLGTAAGVVVSASHNPPTDNGFKALNQYGCQYVPPEDEAILEQVRAVKDIELVDYQQALSEGKIELVGAEMDERYLQTVVDQSLSALRTAKIVYSPIHGAGQRSLLPVLLKAGFDVVTVDEQMEPNGAFPNVANNIPNPEIPTANEKAKELLLQTGRDIAFTTDPDADRLAVQVRVGDEVAMLNGNQTLVLATHYVCRKLKEAGELPANGFLTRTIVTTPMVDAIAAEFQLNVFNDLLVGIKYLGDIIQQQESSGQGVHVIGGEESFGMLKGNYIQEKDAAIGALLIAELASELKDQGKTVIDYLDELYRTYGFYWETLSVKFFEGAAGMQLQTKLMESLRDTPPKQLGGLEVVESSHRVQAKDGTFIVKFVLSGDQSPLVYVRPSGTEPKAKFYVQVRDQRSQDDQASLDTIKQEALALAKRIDDSLQQLATERTEV